MRIRLHGTPTELVDAVDALRSILDVHSVSRPYADRPPTAFQRIYLDANLRRSGEDIR